MNKKYVELFAEPKLMASSATLVYEKVFLKRVYQG